MPHDPTFELTRLEYGPHPKPDEFQALLSIGYSPDEAAMVLDSGLLTFDEWIELYGEEVTTAQEYLEPI